MPSPVRVAYFLDSFAIGGTEMNAVKTAEAVDPARVELCVLHLQTHGPLRSRYEALGLRMEHVPIRSLYSPRTALQGLRTARRLRELQVDVVHSHDLYCNIFAVPWARMLGGCATIASRRWAFEAPRPELVTVNRWASAFAHRVIANSHAVAEILTQHEGVPPAKVVEIPNFLADEAFVARDAAARDAQRRRWGIPEGAFVTGIVARLSPVKNHALLLRAIAALDPRFHLVLVGDGPTRAALEALARELGIVQRTHFVGEMEASANAQQYFDASVLCSTSEGFPNALIEAMALARPVVATPVGGVAETVTDGENGILVPANDPHPLAQALRALEADADLRRRLGEAGRRTVQAKHRKDVAIGRLTSLYEALARREPALLAGSARG